jgi:hypothetical protein
LGKSGSKYALVKKRILDGFEKSLGSDDTEIGAGPGIADPEK